MRNPYLIQKKKQKNSEMENIFHSEYFSAYITHIPSVSVSGTDVLISKRPVSNLGVTFDSCLSMANHVSDVVKSASFHIRNIGRVRQKLTTSSTRTLVQSLVISRIDYCNSLLSGVSSELLGKLQLVQNNAVRLISGVRRREHISPILKELHWLPVAQRVDFKVLLLV